MSSSVYEDSFRDCSSNFADSLSFLAFSTGPKILDRNRALLAFLMVDLNPLAIFEQTDIQECRSVDSRDQRIAEVLCRSRQIGGVFLI